MPQDGQSSPGRSSLACESCKRRKARCDRALPCCMLCEKTSQSCLYPSRRLKPGPIIGSRKHKQNRLRVENIDTLPANQHNDNNIAFGQLPAMKGRTPSGSDRNDSCSSSGRGRIPSPDADWNIPYHESLLPMSPSESEGADLADLSESPGSRATNFIRAVSISSLMHPVHEPYSISPRGNVDGSSIDLSISLKETHSTMTQVCHSMETSIECLEQLTAVYFEHMTSFSLFHQPSFGAKIQGIRNPLHLKALYASMFAFSARFASLSIDRSHPLPTTSCGHEGSQRFLKLATSFTEEALDECEDDMPPLVLLQAMVLTTYHQLTAGVRGRAWRSLVRCVQIAYEKKLHLIDYEAHKDAPTQTDMHRWSANEEKRRCWWAIWEMDVFASTIRRSPTAVDWTMNQTYLPVDDKLWFSNQYQASCFLEQNPVNRWKKLKQSGNESPVAWFIVINSLMRNAQALIRGNLSGILCNKETSDHLFLLRQYFDNSFRKKYSSENTKQQAILDSLRCTISVLPEHLAYRGECLDFAANEPAFLPADPMCSTTKDVRRLHAAKYGIYLMTQQARFMIYHHYSFDEVITGTIFPKERTNATLNWAADIHTDSPHCKGLRNCLEAADDILAIVKNSAHCHVQWVNPFLASTVWLAASMQILSKVFEPDSDMNLIETKCEILRLTCEKYLEFWGTPLALLDNLNALEERLLEKRREDPLAVDLNKSRKGHGEKPNSLSETSGQTDHECNSDGPSRAEPLLTQESSTLNMEELTQPLYDDASVDRLLIPPEPIPNTEWMDTTLGSGTMMHWSLERHSPCDATEVMPAPTVDLDITKPYEPNSIGNSDFTWFS